MLQLPQPFLQRMKQQLQDDYEPFCLTYQQPAWNGLRLNPLKGEANQLVSRLPFSLRPVPWCPTGYYYTADDRPGKHPYHAAGLYYIQEPSAMAVAEVLAAQPGDYVLDLCAAPGGKSTHIAAAMQGQGLLVANELHPARAKILSENIERLGITNAIVLNEQPARLARRFGPIFDRVLVDAPCSGEGMFRKLPEAITDWSVEKVIHCQQMQTEILAEASQLVKPGGILVYSTCTFSPEENEQIVERFLSDHPEFTLENADESGWFQPGNPQWSTTNLTSLTRTARLWPHRLAGEGHFIAKLVKQATVVANEEQQPSAAVSKRKTKHGHSSLKEAIGLWQTFAQEAAPALLSMFEQMECFTLFGEQLYYRPVPWLDLSGLKVLRPGLHLGTIKKNRLEPAHSLALAMSAGQARRTACYAADDEQILRYLRGESLQRQSHEDGWTLVTVDGYPLGWGKQSNHLLKNHFPKGLRWL